MTRSLSVLLESDRVKGFGLMAASALLFGLLGLLIKLLGPGYRVWDIGVYRFVGGLILLPLIFGRREHFLRPLNPRLMMVRGITGTISFLALVMAIQKIALSTAMVLFYSYPAFAALFAVLIFGSRPSRLDLMWISVAIAGVAVLFDLRMEGFVAGQAAAMAAAVGAGFTVTLIRKLRETHGPAIIYFYFCLVGTIVCIGPYLSDPRVPGNAIQWLVVCGIVVTSIGGQVLMNQGFRYCQSWEGGLFMTTEVIHTTVFGILFLGETATWRFWVGGFLIVLSAVSFNLRAHRR